MTPQEIDQLQSVGIQCLEAFLLQLTTAFCYGLSLPVFGYAAVKMSKKSWKARPTQIMVAVGIACFILSTIMLIGCPLTSGVAFNGPIGVTGGDFSEDVVSAQEYQSWIANSLNVWASTFALNASDAVVLWRASVLFHPRPFGFWILYMLYLTTVALSLVTPIRVQTVYSWMYDRDTAVFLNLLNILSGYFSLATNLISTLLIGYKFLGYTSFMRRNGLKRLQKGSSIKRVFIVLIETGILFCVVQGIGIAVQQVGEAKRATPGSQWAIVSWVVGTVPLMLSAVYPLVVTALVYSQESVINAYQSASLSVDNRIRLQMADGAE